MKQSPPLRRTTTAFSPHTSQTLRTLLLMAAVTLPWNSHAASEDLFDLSLKDLLSLEVSSVSRRLQQLKDTAAAVYVISGEDIKRSGITTLPDALRMVPGMQYARTNANTWTISARGFNSQWANKLLVLIDGRSVYKPSYSAVNWDAHDLVLDDVERIEVIRGPGGTLWGANAVNGIINIITKSAADTKGGLFTAGFGNEQQLVSELRYGGRLNEDFDGRVFVKYQETDDAVLTDGATDGFDGWHSVHAGFRVDGALGVNDDLTMQGEVYSLEGNQVIDMLPVPPPLYFEKRYGEFESRGWHVLGRWNRQWSSSTQSSLQVYYDHTFRSEIALAHKLDTLDIDWQHQFEFGERHSVIWGAGYRSVNDHYGNSFYLNVVPADRTSEVISAFVQDEISLIKNRLKFTAGSKIERNDYTGVEVQPSARLVWIINDAHTLWGAVSRAVRTPSRMEVDAHVIAATVVVAPPPVPPVFIFVEPNPQQESENVVAYEVGYRVQPTDNFQLDMTAFYNVYEDQQSYDTFQSLFDIKFGNKLEGNGYGVEVAMDYRPTDWWRLQPSYSFFRFDGNIKPGSGDAVSIRLREGSTPHHQAAIRSNMDLPDNWSFDVWLSYVSKLTGQGALISVDVPGYTSLSLRLAWQPTDNLEFSIAGHNLLHKNQVQFVSESPLPSSAMQRAVIAQLRWHW